VSRLEIFGFKSFMDRLVLPLEGGITGVVGPNGCGKSNIVDAIRWVLGETRARELRGGILEDVIFNGTDSLRPLGLAEVTLTLRGEPNDFLQAISNVDSTQVTTLEGDETSAEKDEAVVAEPINPSSSSGRPNLSVIRGALCGAPLQHNADEETPSTAETVNSAHLVSRFGWLNSLSELQVTRRLYRSGESEFFINRVPCRLRDIKDLFRAVHLGARAYTIIAQGEVGRIVNAKPEDRRLIFEEAAGVSGFRDKIAEAKRRLEEAKAGVARVDDIVKELTRQVQSLKRKAERARERDNLKQEIFKLDRLVFIQTVSRLKRRSEALLKDISECDAQEQAAIVALEQIAEKERLLRASFSEVDNDGVALRRQMDSIRDELSRHNRKINERRSVLNEIRTLIRAHDAEVLRLHERNDTIQKRLSQSEAEVVNLQSQDKEITEKLIQADRGSETELKDIAQSLAVFREEFRSKERVHREARDVMVACKSRLQAVKEQVIAASPLRQLSKTVGSKAFQELKLDSTRSFVEALTVPVRYVRAVQSVLNEKANYLLTDSPHEIGRRFVQHLEKLSEKEGRGLGLGVFLEGGSDKVKADCELIGLPKLRSLITVAPYAEAAADAVFGKVLVATNLEEAQQWFLSSNKHDDVTVVTEQGDVLTNQSFFSLRHEGGVVALRAKEAELEQSLKAAEDNYELLNKEREVLIAQISAAEKAHAELLKETQRRQAVIRDLGREQGSIRGRLQAASRLVEQMKQDVINIQKELSQSDNKKTELSTREIGVADEVSALEAASTAGPEQELIRLKSELDSIEQARSEARSQMNQITAQLNERRRAVESIRRKQSDLRVNCERVLIEQRTTTERLSEEYPEGFAQELLQEANQLSDDALISEDLLTKERNSLVQLRRRLQKEGEVDPSSIQAYEEENARLTELMLQKRDLEDGAKVLNESVNQVVSGAEKRLLHTFNIVQEKFQQLIPRVFGGGSGALTLSDPQNPLESGVAIMVRPPGKIPKSIDLLSGGEKALTATALIMALFSYAPSPLCVLDEVDAPLDEANLIRFLELIKEMSISTQFIIVTHNKQSMSMANRLVGVTMEQPGASKMISVSLQEAVAQVA
jgi:chromosome segregation protein